jgi:hypothetical protein
MIFLRDEIVDNPLARDSRAANFQLGNYRNCFLALD